ncbi:MAG: crotonase/enoyl-CoA hydratase family protein [Actinobacteria bacterium]|nr:crotonase/enoyl-CoA hydratase family protein [Actinomycetota bacterium]
MKQAVRIENDGGVRSLVLCRGDEYNTITPQFRDEFGAALDEADTDPTVRVVLIRAEGPAFCAGFGLDWSTLAQATEESGPERVWDSVADMAMIGSFADTWAKLFELSKPTVAAVHGWCIAGGTDMILNADMIIAADTARFGYPPARVWGTPEAPWMWVARLGLERAKRYLLTGDEMTGAEAAEIGFVLEAVPEDELLDAATALAQRMALLPLNQLQMLKLLCNDVARDMYRPERSRLLGTLFDGVARHTQEGLDFVSRAQEVGWRQVVRERDEPFGDYGSRPNDTGT